MSPSRHLYFLCVLLGFAPPSWTQDTSVMPHLDTSMAPNVDMKNNSTPSGETTASSLSTALSPTISVLQLTSKDPYKDSKDTGQTQPENKMETTSKMANLDRTTVGRRTKSQTPISSSQEETWNPFKSDEYTLRKRGLLAAAILFITGILILTSDRCHQFRWCRRQQRSAYRVTQA